MVAIRPFLSIIQVAVAVAVQADAAAAAKIEYGENTRQENLSKENRIHHHTYGTH